MGLFKKRDDGKEVPDHPYEVPTGGVLGGECNHAGATSVVTEDVNAHTIVLSCSRCCATWTEGR